MSTRHLIGHLRVLWRTERTVTELRLKHLLTNLGLQALAMLIAACALLLFELAAYFALVQRWDAIWSAIALGVFDLVLAGAIILIALRRPAGRELTVAQETHQQAISAFEEDLHGGGPIRAAIENVVIPVLLPLIPVIIERVRSHKAEAVTDDAA
jgi:putative superfamily III holin-X